MTRHDAILRPRTGHFGDPGSLRVSRAAWRTALALMLLALAVPLAPAGADETTAAPSRIYVPYQDLASVVDPAAKNVLMERAAFEKLLAAAQARQVDQSIPLGQVTGAAYKASVSGDRLSLTGDLNVLSLSDMPVAVPLKLAQLSVTQILLDGKPAPLGYDRNQLVLMVAKRGVHRVQLTASALLREMSGGGMQFTITLPSSVAGSMALSAPGDLSVHATVPTSKCVYHRGLDRTSVKLTLGGHETLSVALTGNGRQEDLRAILLGESVTHVELAPAHQSLRCLYTAQVLRRGAAELEFALDPAWTVLDVTCPNLIRWSIRADGDQRQILSVRLRQAARGSQSLHIHALAPRAGQSTWTSPRVNLVGAAFQRGYLVVDTGNQLLVRGEKLANARREDRTAASTVDGLSAGGGRIYYHWGNHWSVALELSDVTLRRFSEDRQTLHVTPKQLTLEGRFLVTALGRESFDLDFLLPGDRLGWTIYKLTVNGQEQGFEYRLADQQGRRKLTIELARPIPSEASAEVLLTLRAAAPWEFDAKDQVEQLAVGLIHPLLDSVSGVVAVTTQDESAGPAGAQDLDADVAKAPPALKPVNVGRMASLGLGATVQTAYTYDQPVDGHLELKVQRRLPRMTAQAVGLVNVRPTSLAGTWTITYDVSQARTQTLHVLADKSLGPQIDLSVPGQRLSGRRIVDKPSLPVPAGYDLWQLDLDAHVFGTVQVRAAYERALPGPAFDVPLVRPYAAQSSEVLAVEASEELAVTVSGKCAGEIDTVDLPALPVTPTRLLAAMRLEAPTTARGASACVHLQTQKHNPYAIPPAVAAKAEFTTYLGADGAQRTEAVFHIANAALQFITLRLPPDAQLWSTSIAGETVKPKRDDAGNFLLTLPRSDTPLPVRVVYFCVPPKTEEGMVRLGGLSLRDRDGRGGREVKINFLQWKVIPPPGLRVVKQKQRGHLIYIERPDPAFVTLAQTLEVASAKTAYLDALQDLAASSDSTVGGRRTHRVEGEDEGPFDKEDKAKAPQTTAEEAAPKPGIQPPPGPGRKPVGKDELNIDTMVEGWHTLPVDLVPTPEGGPALFTDSLGPADLSVGLSSPTEDLTWLGLGTAIMLIWGLILRRSRLWVRFNLIFLSLLLSSLLALWVPVGWPTAVPMLVYLLNGAFYGTLLLIPLYLVMGLARRVWRPAAAPRPAAAAGGLLLAVTLALTFSAARAAEPKTPGPRMDPEIQEAIRRETQLLQAATQPVIVPYEGDVSKAEQADKVLVPYARFVQLWNRVHPDQPLDMPTPAGGIALADVRYAATVSEREMAIVLTAQVQTYGSSYVTLPMPLSGLAVTEATFDGKPAALQVGPKGMILTLEGGRTGTLKLVGAATPKYVGRRGSITLTLPPLPGGVMTVLLGQEDLVLDAHGIEGGLDRRKVNNGVEWTFGLGRNRRLSLTWAPKAGGGTADRTLAATGSHDVYFFHWAQVGVSKFTFTFSAADYDRFTLLVPHGTTLTDLSGANLRDYRSVGRQNIDGQQFDLIEARLHRPAVRKYELTARWMGDLPPLDKPVALPLVQAGDVARESGTVTLHAAGGMSVKVPQVMGGRKSSTANFSPLTAAGLTQMVAQYYWPYRPFSLQAQVARQSVQPVVRLDQLVRVGTRQVQLLVQARLSSPQGQLFSARFSLPDGYELLSAVGPAVEDHYVQPAPEGRRLQVNFREGVDRTDVALVLVRRFDKLDRLDVPHLTALDESGKPIEQRGRLAVQVQSSLAAHTIASENLKPIVPNAASDWLEAGQVEAVRFAYQYETPKISLALQVARQETKVRAEVFAGLSLSHTEAAYAYRLRYTIEGSPVDRVRFSLPARYAPLVTVTSNALRSVSRTVDKDRCTWTVSLLNEVISELDVMVNFSLPVDAETTSLEIPTVVTDSSAGYTAIVAVQNFSSHELTLAEHNRLSELPADEQLKLLSSQVRQSLQYVMKSLRPDWSMKLKLIPAKAASRIQVVIDLLAMTTVIDRSGHLRHEARLELQNRSEQFLRVRLMARTPRGQVVSLPLWSAEVAGQPVRPVQPADSSSGDVLVPLVKTSPGGLPYEVRLYFAGRGVPTLGAVTRIQPPVLLVTAEDPHNSSKPRPIPVIRTTWSLLLPSGYTYVQRGGNMTPASEQAELMSLAIDARLDQLQRLRQGYAESAVSSRSRKIAQKNWKAFNAQVTEEIRQAENYLKGNRYRISGPTYENLSKKLADQANSQYGLLGQWDQDQQDQSERQKGDVTSFLNTSGQNPGVSEAQRNQALNSLPNFVTGAARAQQENLEKEIDSLQKSTATQPARTVRPGDLLVEDETTQKGDILRELEGEKNRQLAKRQEEVRQQIDQLSGPNRLNRFYNQPTPQQGQMAQGQPGRGDQMPQAEQPKSGGAKPTPPPPPAPSQPRGEGAAQVYVPHARYSLSLELPQGQARQDFVHPSGDASLVLYAIRDDLVRSAYATAAILALIVLVYLSRYIWRHVRHAA